MELSESVLTDLYFWFFAVSPDVLTSNTASSADGNNLVEIIQDQTPEQELIWIVSVLTSTTKISAFEPNLAEGIDNLKNAWTNKDIV